MKRILASIALLCALAAPGFSSGIQGPAFVVISFSVDPACNAGNYYIWFNTSSQLFKQCNNGTISIIGATGTAGLFTATANAPNDHVASDTTLVGTGVGSTTTVANYFVAGSTLNIQASGFISTAATPDTINVKIKAGSTVVGQTGAITLPANLSSQAWRLTATITCRTTGVSGTFIVNTIFETTQSTLAPQNAKIVNTSTVTLDTTGTLAWNLTAAWGGTTAGDTITGTNFTMMSPTSTSANGTVSSVGLSLPSGLMSVSGSPVVSSGTLTGTLASHIDLTSATDIKLPGATTAGSVWFGGTGGILAQDNANFFWDATNHRLGLGTTAPNEILTIAKGQHLGFIDTSGTLTGFKIDLQSGNNVLISQLNHGNITYQAGVSANASNAHIFQVHNTTAWTIDDNGNWLGSIAGAYDSWTAGSDPTCQTGNYFIWANSSTKNLKKCENGTISAIGSGSSAVSSVFGRTGAVTAQSGDYTAALVTNAVDKTAANTYSGGGLQDFSNVKFKMPLSTVASLPAASGATNQVYVVTDGTSSGDCTVGGGSTQSYCISNGVAWVSLGGGTGCNVSGTGAVFSNTGTCQVDTGITHSSGSLTLTGSVTTGSGGSTAGAYDMGQGTDSPLSENSWSWGAGTTITTKWRGIMPNAVPSANQFMLFPAPTSNESVWAWTGFASPLTVSGGNVTFSNQNANTIFAGPSSGSAATPGFRAMVPLDLVSGVNAQSGTSYTIAASDNGKLVTSNNGSAVAWTLPQSGTAGFGNGFLIYAFNRGAGAVTITPTTSTINGGSTVTLNQNQGAFIVGDGTNYSAWISAAPSGSGTVTSAAVATNNANHITTTGTCTITTSGTCTLDLAARVTTRAIPFTIGVPGGTALTVSANTTDYVTVPFACTISAYNLVIDSGTITVKFWKVATGTAIPTSSNSINTSGVGISTGTAIHSTTVSDFTTTTVSANDIMAMNVTAVSGAAFVNGVLECDQ